MNSFGIKRSFTVLRNSFFGVAIVTNALASAADSMAISGLMTTKVINAYDKSEKRIKQQTIPVLDLTKGIEGAAKTVLMVTKNHLTAQSCEDNLKILNSSLFYIQSGEFLDMANQGANSNQDAITLLFDSRVQLTEKLRDFVSGRNGVAKFSDENQMRGCVNEMRVSHRSLRNLEDRIALTAYLNQGKYKKPGALTGLPSADLGLKPFEQNEWPKLMVSSKYSEKRNLSLADLKTGDVFLTKGTTFASAVISRIGKVDNQFSHLAMVYVDEKGELFGEKNAGKVYVVESEPDFGLQIVALDHFLKNDKNRLVLYRYSPVAGPNGTDSSSNDAAEVVKRAARYAAERADVRANPYDKEGKDTTMVDRLAQHKKTTGQDKIERIGYNFEMDMNVESTLFCSQVISWAMKNGCVGLKCQSFPELGNSGDNIFPLDQSEIVTENNGFAKMLQLGISKTFAPADFEVEPRFELIAEWRDVNYSAYTRIQDIATTKFFQLMEESGYEFIETPELKAFAEAATKLLKDNGKMPENMPDGLTKGSLYTAFLTWHPGLSQIVPGAIENANPSTLMNMLVNALGIAPETLKALMDDGTESATAEKQAEKLRQVALRFAQHASIIKVVQDAEQKQIEAALKEKQESNSKTLQRATFMTERLMSSVIDAKRGQDCEIYKITQNGTQVTAAMRIEKKLGSSTVVWHDLVRIPEEKIQSRGQVCETEPLELNQF